jgi:hypothetical protein
MQGEKAVLLALQVEEITVFRCVTCLILPRAAGNVQSSVEL